MAKNKEVFPAEEGVLAEETRPAETLTQETAPGKPFIVKAENGLNLREAPSKSSKSLGVIAHGTTVEGFLDTDAELGWMPIAIGVFTGWAMTEFLEPVE